MHTKIDQDTQEGAAVNKSPKVRLQSTIMTKMKREQVTKKALHWKHQIGTKMRNNKVNQERGLQNNHTSEVKSHDTYQSEDKRKAITDEL